MKKLIMVVAVSYTALLIGCGNGDDAAEVLEDSANTLQDTFPANGFKDSMSVDSHAADKTHVDSLNKIP
jgi:major membrane immunogen (membrane-anchored lipoprotein)